MIRRVATYWRLGPLNLARVAAYRMLLRAGLHPVQWLRAETPMGPFFGAAARSPPPGAKARTSWRDAAVFFGWLEQRLDGSPDWLAGFPGSGVRLDGSRPWWRIPDFDPCVGDIKAVWEASRFDWLLAMAQRAALGDADELLRLNDWIDDWLQANPPYHGPNWKCGQEASIRVMHLAVAGLLLDQVEAPTPALCDLLRVHLRRIAPTMSYALGQQNNHGTSEAAALFIGGAWLEGSGDPEAAGWRRAGRRWLENRAQALIEPDGTFSQYSVNYHRMMLDTYSLAEVWRQRLELPIWSEIALLRLRSAVLWLYALVDPNTGDAPNLGANDGARIVVLGDTDYRDFRPSVQLAAHLFLQARAYEAGGDWDQPLIWLGQERSFQALESPLSQTFDDGGLHILRRGQAVAFLRYPRFRFRPSQSDALHVDLWLNGENLLRDSGTYSYAVSPEESARFQGVAGHNTVQLDGREPMPRIGRFLFADWLRATAVSAPELVDQAVAASAGYRDSVGGVVKRRVLLGENSMVCRDEIEGSASSAIVRWRLAPGDWKLLGDTLAGEKAVIRVECSAFIRRLECVPGVESRYYLQKTGVPVLEVEVEAPCVLTTRVSF